MMEHENSKEWRNLTFSQRMGKAPLPEALQAGELTRKFRNQVWLVIGNSIDLGEHKDCFGDFVEGSYWTKLPRSYLVYIRNIPHDEIEITGPYEVKEWLKNIIVDREAHEVITLLEYMLRYSNMPEDMANDIAECFEFAPYLIDQSSEPVCLIPTTSAEMKEKIKRSLDNINQSELPALTGAKTHFRDAAQRLNNNNFADSIRESIHAVESAILKIAPKTKGFSGALDSLEKHGMIKHPALKEAFKKLYGYTSDEKGIRHALIDSDKANVGFDEAIFMYGACVSFVDYLVSKIRQLEKNDAA